MKKNIGLAILLAIFVKTNDVSASSKGRVVEISGRNNKVITGQEIKELNLTDSDSLVISGNSDLDINDYELSILNIGNGKMINVKSIIFSKNHMGLSSRDQSSTNFIKISGIVTILARDNISISENSSIVSKNNKNNVENLLNMNYESCVTINAKNIEICHNSIYTKDKINSAIIYANGNGFLSIGTYYSPSYYQILGTESVTISENIVENPTISSADLLKFSCKAEICAKNINFIKNTVINGNILNTNTQTTLKAQWYENKGGYHLGGSVIISENIAGSKIIDNTGSFYIKASKIIINKNKLAPNYSLMHGSNDKYGVLIRNKGDMTFELLERNTVFELADNSLIDGNDDKGIIGILLEEEGILNFAGSLFSRTCEIKLGYDILSNYYSWSTTTFSGNLNIELGAHIIESYNINIKGKINIHVDVGKNGLIGNLRSSSLRRESNQNYKNYSLLFIKNGYVGVPALTFEPSFAENFEDDGEGELKYKVISGFKNIIVSKEDLIRLKDDRRKLEWNGGVYSTKLVCEGNDFSIVLNRIVPPIKIDNTSENSDDNGSDDW